MEDTAEEVLLDVGNVRDVGVRIGGVMAEGAMATIDVKQGSER